MKHVFVFLVVLAITISSACFAGEKQQDKGLTTQKEKASYVIGVQIGKDLKQQLVDIDPEVLARGLKDGFSGSKLLMTDEEARQTMAGVQKEMRARQEEATRKLGEKNKKEGEAFLAENRKRADVKSLPSGLQYRTITEGTGRSPKATDTVVVHYRGTLLDGTEFDSSYRRGQPATFPVGGVIKGWTEALQLMKVGSKWQLFIPPELAYGDRGSGRAIGPGATLIFEVELIDVK